MRFTGLFTILILSYSANAQDTILKVHGEEVVAQILTMSSENLEYKKFDYPEGPTYVLPLEEVFMIKMENGVKYVFREHLADSLQTSDNWTYQELYRKGQMDAAENYEPYIDLAISSLSTCAMPVISIPALIIKGLTDPKIKDSEWPDKTLAASEAYKKGYIQKKKALRNSSYFKGAGLVSLIYIAYYGVMIYLFTL